MIFGGLCRAIYQGLRGLCMYGLSNSRSPAQIVVRETPSVFTSKRPRSLISRQRNVVKNCEVFSFRKPVDPVRSRSKRTGSLYSVAVERTDPMWSHNKRTESLHSVAVEPTDPIWSQNKTTESLRSVAVERTTEQRSQDIKSCDYTV